jgi:hypothetical protein
MPAYHIQASQLGLNNHNRYHTSNLVALVEAKTPFATEARKGNLYIFVEHDEDLTKGHDVCQQATRVVRKTFYEDTSLSVTSSLRAAIHAANKALYQHNLSAAMHKRAYVGITCAVVKGHDLFLAQVSPAQAYVWTDGAMRAMPAHPAWKPGHTSASPFIKSRVALGSSLFVEPELYRCLLRQNDAFLLCSTNIAHILQTHQVETMLREENTEQTMDGLAVLCEQQHLADAHALLVRCVPIPAKEQKMVDTSGRPSGWNILSLGQWVARLARLTGGNPPSPTAAPNTPVTQGQAANGTTNQEQPGGQHGEEPTTVHPEPPEHPSMLYPTIRELDMGESLEQQYAHHRSEQEAAQQQGQGLSPIRTSADIGEHDDDTFLVNQSALDVQHLPPKPPEPTPYQPRRKLRPAVDMPWYERIILPVFSVLELLVAFIKNPRASISPPRPATTYRSRAAEEEDKPTFPWLQLVALMLFLAVLILYGLNLSRQSDEQKNLEYIEQARQYLIQMEQAPDHETAMTKLEHANQALEQVRSSLLVTSTNPVLWLPYREVEMEYEHGLAHIQRLTFFDDPVVLAEQLLPNGRFDSVVVPPPTSSITDPYTVEAMRYIYALDGDKNKARVYRIPQEGGVPEPLLSPDDMVQNVMVGSIQAISWRIDNVVAIDQTANNFGYYFRSEGIWNYTRLGGSEIWAPLGRIDLETYEGNLYLWGAEPSEVIKFSSGRYGDVPQLWLDAASAESMDLSSVVDMEIDGKIYLLLPQGEILVFHMGSFERRIVPGDITPPITAITRMVVTGGPENGWVFLLDTLNERVIQLDKETGTVIQQMKVRGDSDVQLNRLTDMAVDDSTGRPLLYLVNGGQIIQAGMPAPPVPVDQPISGN